MLGGGVRYRHDGRSTAESSVNLAFLIQEGVLVE